MGFFSAIGGALLGGAVDYFTGKSLADDQMDFQERMANTQYQRAVEDMRKAGINPMLAAKLGGNAVPPGSSITPTSIGSSAVSNYRANRQLEEQVKGLKLDNAGKSLNLDYIAAQTDKLNQDKEESYWRTRQNQLYIDHLMPLEIYTAGQQFQNAVEQGKQLKNSTFQQYIVNQALQQNPTLRKLFAVPSAQDFVLSEELFGKGQGALTQKLEKYAPLLLKMIR